MFFRWKKFLLPVCFCFILMLNAEERKLLSGSSFLGPDKFGPVIHRSLSSEYCKGPKRRDCGKNSIIRDFRKSETIEFIFDIPRNVEYSKAKIAMYMNNNSTTGTPDIVKWINEPCSHFIYGQILKTYFNYTNSKCNILKGVYKFKVNASAVFYEMIGHEFFYGTYWSQSIGMSRDCNIFCVQFKFSLEKRI